MTCGALKTYTPAQMIAYLVVAFLVDGSPPGIDANGKPVYKIAADHGEEALGCAVYTIYRAHPELMSKMASFGTHEACPASQLARSGVENITTIGCNECSSSFLAGLQRAHDAAAIESHREAQHRGRLAALARFREVILRELRGIQGDMNVIDFCYTKPSWSQVQAEIANFLRPLPCARVLVERMQKEADADAALLETAGACSATE